MLTPSRQRRLRRFAPAPPNESRVHFTLLLPGEESAILRTRRAWAHSGQLRGRLAHPRAPRPGHCPSMCRTLCKSHGRTREVRRHVGSGRPAACRPVSFPDLTPRRADASFVHLTVTPAPPGLRSRGCALHVAELSRLSAHPGRTLPSAFGRGGSCFLAAEDRGRLTDRTPRVSPLEPPLHPEQTHALDTPLSSCKGMSRAASSNTSCRNSEDSDQKPVTGCLGKGRLTVKGPEGTSK